MVAMEFSLPFYETALEFLAGGPSPLEIVRYRPSATAQQRFSELLEANRQRSLTLAEEEELDHTIRFERMMTLLKAKAYSRLGLIAA